MCGVVLVALAAVQAITEVWRRSSADASVRSSRWPGRPQTRSSSATTSGSPCWSAWPRWPAPGRGGSTSTPRRSRNREEDEGTSVFGGLFGRRGPAVPMGTWVVATERAPASVGISHGVREKVVPRLREAGVHARDGWHLVQDNPRRGLVARLPAGRPPRRDPRLADVGHRRALPRRPHRPLARRDAPPKLKLARPERMAPPARQFRGWADPGVDAGGGQRRPRRLAVRRWLEEHPDPSPAELAAAGLVAPGWPAPWGLGADPDHRLIVDEELRRAGVERPDNPIALGWAGPTLLAGGDDAQQQRWLPGILDGSEFWCQLFSEPEAGSDLAALRTRAERGRRRLRRERPEDLVDVGRPRATSASCWPGPTRPARSTRASPTSCSTWRRRASRCGRSPR